MTHTERTNAVRASLQCEEQRDRHRDAPRRLHQPARPVISQADAERWKAALEEIAGAESGVWGWIAHNALYPRKAA